ncbi:adenylate/guanylate cyclase domain-containing protein [Lichenifustis flavocetrariae]|uniref:Adenylate/guanylate cyclase domain-containing protein n=1 Tax=Lichenifustis flavocetrariae TaxID=2949735 RepID=A0AA41YW70_9HYPH|nr:adenylate/guanylate cyclase domain-containing protein [Lichenifustis flavocetrariae]MCW6508351.1 adenylate/guanylate cyclase domain-containing protein [Lichenifustis flavocetrariae]
MPNVATIQPGDYADAPETGLWPARRTSVLDWLVNRTRDQRFLDNIFVELCQRLEASGVGVARAAMFLQTNHPQWLGVRIYWRRGMTEAEMKGSEYESVDSDTYLRSPAAAIHAGVPEIRARLHATPGADDAFPILQDMRQEGMTDYVAWPFSFTLGKQHFITFATDRPGGFRDDELTQLVELLPVLATVVDLRLKNRLARLLLDTYVGPHAGEAILGGATRRGSGFTVEAAIVVVDLRGFTSISDLWPRDDVIALLNDYFDALSEPIEKHGGEILKFMGDGLLAIFPDDAKAATRAVADICRSMAALNLSRQASGQDPLGYGVGVNFGDVMYGNIGSRTRLDFTVIGPAVNIASRLETLTKTVEPHVLFSAAFVARTGCRAMLKPVGTYPVQGVGQPIDVYTFAEDPVLSEPQSCSAEKG